ncbi:unnamed protein product, partial [marine sediment metagenome]
MCLTLEAELERKWGRYPALRKALEDKRVPDRYYGLTSASDNMFDQIQRLLEIGIAVREYGEAIKDLSLSGDREEIGRDLNRIC